MPNQVTKKQHYIPQFYLRQWADADGCFYPIRIESNIPPVLNVFKDKSSPVRFCYENFFYAQHTGESDEGSQTIEKGFAEIEGVFSKNLPEIEAKILDNREITPRDKYHLAEFMIFLWIRGKQYREQSKKMSEHTIKELNKHLVHFMDKNPKMKARLDASGLTKKDMIDFAERGEYSIDFGNMHHLSIIKEMPGFCSLLAAKYWKVSISRDGGFITTDAPYLDISVSSHFYGNDFWSREQDFVLSPRVAITALYPKNLHGKNFVRKDITGDKDLIQAMNCYYLMNALRFGFHSDQKLMQSLAKYVKQVYDYKTRLSPNLG